MLYLANVANRPRAGQSAAAGRAGGSRLPAGGKPSCSAPLQESKFHLVLLPDGPSEKLSTREGSRLERFGSEIWSGGRERKRLSLPMCGRVGIVLGHWRKVPIFGAQVLRGVKTVIQARLLDEKALKGSGPVG